MTRYRPLIIRCETNLDPAGAKQRAEWEKTVRAARSVVVSVVVQGFREDNGLLWMDNSLIDVDIPYLRLQQQLLISKVTYKRDARSGSTTTLELKDPKAFQPELKKQSDKKKGAAGGAKNAPIESEQDLQTRVAEDAAKQQHQIKEGKR